MDGARGDMDEAGVSASSLGLRIGEPGRRPAKLEFDVLRPLEPSDLALQDQAELAQGPVLKRLSSRHQTLAKLIASGTKPGDAAIIVGIRGAWVSTLQNDPAFKELVQFYRDGLEEAFLERVERLAGFSQDVLEELQRRLEDQPDGFSNKELQGLLEATLDRTGVGPSSKTEHNVNINLGERLDAARRRSLEAKRAQLRDITPPEERE